MNARRQAEAAPAPAAPRRFRFTMPKHGTPWSGVAWADGTVTICQEQFGATHHYGSLRTMRQVAGLDGDDIEWLDPYVPAGQILPPGEPQVMAHVCREQARRAVEQFKGIHGGGGEAIYGELQDLVEEACRNTTKALLKAQGVI